MSYDLECPYCEAELEVCHDDGFGYQEGVKHKMECNKCNKNFVFETSILFCYEPEKADCLNDGEHEWRLRKSYPPQYSTMECIYCEATKPLTDEQMRLLTSVK